MIHYHVWFDLKKDVPERDGLSAVSRFLADLCQSGRAAGYEMLRNQGEPPKSRMPRFAVLIRFRDDEQFQEAFRRQADEGVHSGAHGEFVDLVCNFHAEFFSRLDPLGAESFQACEI